MEAIQSSIRMLSKILLPQGNGATDKAVSQKTGDSGFDSTLKAFLGNDPAKKVSEEELFSALIQERIKKTKGDDALKEFQGLLSETKTRLTKPDGYVPHEDATKEALRAFRDAGKLKAEEADSLYSQAFAAAQLDENKEVLFDDRGGPNDPTMAVAEMEQALLLSRALVEKYDAGSEVAPVRSLSELSNGKAYGGAGGVYPGGGDTGFLYKPVSESDGKLVVLLPPRLTGLVKGLTLIGPNGEVIEQGRYTGNGNGGREHFRFGKPGAQYPDGLTVQATLATGELVRYIIRETSERAEHVSSSAGGDDQQSQSNNSGQQKPGQDNSSL